MRILLAVLFIGAASSRGIHSDHSDHPGLPGDLHRPKAVYRLLLDSANAIMGAMPYTGIYMNLTFSVSFCKDDDYAVEVEECSIGPMPEHLTGRPQSLVCKQLLENHLHFSYNNGRVTELRPPTKLPDTILNIYRAILSSFQVKTVGYDDNRQEMETDLFGDCPTTINEYHHGGDMATIQKSRDLAKCEQMTQLSILPRNKYYTQAKAFSGIYKALYNLNLTTPEIDVPRQWPYIMRMEFEQDSSFSPLTQEAGVMTSFFNKTVLFLRYEETTCPIEATKLVVKDIKFSNPIDSCHSTIENCQENVRTVMAKAVNAKAWEVPTVFRELIDILRKCNKGDLTTMVVKYSICGNNFDDHTSEDRFKHSFFLDALAYTWTDESFETIVDVVVNNCLTANRKHELMVGMTMMPVHLIQSCKPIEWALKLFTMTQTMTNHQTPYDFKFNFLYFMRTYPHTSGLTLGSLIGTYSKTMLWNRQCKDILKEGTEKLLERFDYYYNQLPSTFSFNPEPTNDDKLTWERAIESMKALASTGHPRAINPIVSAAKDNKLQLEGRLIAVQILEKFVPIVPQHIRDIALTLYMDKTMEDQLRAATLPIFMTSFLTSHRSNYNLIYKFIDFVMKEKRMSVVSFTCTYLREVVATDDPLWKETAQTFDWLMKYSGLHLLCPSKDYGYFSSKAWRGFVSIADFSLPKSIPRDTFGVGIDSRFYSDYKTKIPNEFNSRVKLSALGYDFELFKFGMRGTGLDRLMRTVFGPTGIVRHGVQDLNVSGLPRKGDFKFDLPEVNISVSTWFDVLGNELWWYHTEQPDFLRFLFGDNRNVALQDAWTHFLTEKDFSYYSLARIAEAWKDTTKPEPKDWINTFYEKGQHWWKMGHKMWTYFMEGDFVVDERQYDFSKNLKLADVKTFMPTISGFPLRTEVTTDVHVGLKANTKLTYHSDGYMWNKTSERFILDGLLNPKMSIYSEAKIFLDDCFFFPALVLRANGSSTFNQSGRAVLHDDFNFTWDINEIPENTTELFKIQYDQYLTVDNETFLVGIDKRNNTQLIDPIGEDLLGLALYSEMSYANSTGVDQAPWFPFSGPANLSLTVRRVDPRITGIQIKYFNDSRVYWCKGDSVVEITTVGGDKSIRLNSQWWQDENKEKFPCDGPWYMETEVTSKPGYMTTNLVWDKTLDIKSRGLIHTPTSNTTFSVAVNWTNVNGTIERRRHTVDHSTAVFRIPEFRLDFNGTVVNETYVNGSAVLHMEGWCLPQWARLNATVLGLLVNGRLHSSALRMPLDFGDVLPVPIRSPVCHYFGRHLITFDGRPYSLCRDDNEYVVVRDRRLNDTFAVTIKGPVVKLFINEIEYTLTPDVTQFRIGNEFIALPYEKVGEIYVRKEVSVGKPFVRLNASVGVEIYYFGGNDVMIKVDGYYMGRTAGLCGNANYDPRDDWQKNDLTLTNNKMDFINDWKIQGIRETEEEVATKVEEGYGTTEEERERYEEGYPETKEILCECRREKIDISQSDLNICKFYFEVVFRGIGLIYPVPYYYNACIRDVKCGISPLVSIGAFLHFAYGKEIEIDSCRYSNWTQWQKCSVNSVQIRTRDVEFNPLSVVCQNRIEKRKCVQPVAGTVDPYCILEKSHVFQISGNKVCKSRHSSPVCRTRTSSKEFECKPIAEEPSLEQFHCIESGDDPAKFVNVSPIYLSHFVPKGCSYVKKVPKPDQ